MSAGVIVGAEVRERLALERARLGGEHDPFAVVWAEMSPELRQRILVVAGLSWWGVSGVWHDVPAQYRGEIKRRCRALRDELLRVFPLDGDQAGAVS